MGPRQHQGTRRRKDHIVSLAFVANNRRLGIIFDRGVDAILETLTSRTPQAIDLRQNSPFAGVLPPEDRERATPSPPAKGMAWPLNKWTPTMVCGS